MARKNDIVVKLNKGDSVGEFKGHMAIVNKPKKKRYTLNVDIEVEAKNEVEAIQKICTPIAKAGLKYWAGNLERSENFQ